MRDDGHPNGHSAATAGVCQDHGIHLRELRATHGLGVALAVGLSMVVVGQILVPVTCRHIQEERAEAQWVRQVERHQAAITRRFGAARVESDDRQEYDAFEVLYLDESVALRVLVRADMRPVSPGLLDALSQGEIGSRYEGAGGLVYDDTTGTLRLIRSYPLRDHDLVRRIEDLRELAGYWHERWLDEVRAIHEGRAPRPAEFVWRPGRDPASVLKEIEEFTRTAPR